MTSPVRQWFEVPNSYNVAVQTCKGSFAQSTLPGATILVIATNSYDITTTGTLTDTQGQNYPLKNYIADTSSPNQGHQAFDTFVMANSKALSPSDVLTFTTTGADYSGFVGFELAAGSAFAQVVSSWQQGLTNPPANGLTSGAASLAAGTYAMVSTCCNTTVSGQGPYLPLMGSGQTSVGAWFADQAVGGADIASIASQTFTLAAAGSIQALFSAPAGTSDENFITIAAIFATGAPVTNPTINLTSAQVSALAAGTTVSQPITTDIPAGSQLQIVPPSSGGGASPDKTVVMAGSAALITDNQGNTWGIGGPGTNQVTKNGVVDKGTSSVKEIAWVSSVIWQFNGVNWYSKTATGWSKPTTTSPLGPTPPPPNGNPTVKYPIFLNGKFYWAGDWNEPGAVMNYAYAAPGVVGGGPVIQFPGNLANEYWLPYPPVNSAGPASNGTNWQLQGTHFTIAVKASGSGGLLQMCWFTAKGTTNDIEATNMLTINDPAYLVYSANGYNVYSIPFTAWTWVAGSVPGWIYKLNINQQGVTPQQYLIDQMGTY